MEMQKDFFSNLENRLGLLSDDARKGLLFLCLIEGKMEFIDLSELLQAPEAIDELTNLSFTHADPQSIEVESDTNKALLQRYKWSEKVSASRSLIVYFQNKFLGKEKLGDLWLLAGNKENAKSEFLSALNQYKVEQLHSLVIRVGEKVSNLGMLSQTEEIEVYQNMVSSYECCGELAQVIVIREKLLENLTIKKDVHQYASVLRALAIDYSQQGSWHLYKQLRTKAANIFRKNKDFKESAVEFMALAIKAVDDLNLSKGLEYCEEALVDSQMAGQVEHTCKSMAIKSYILAMEGNYSSGQTLAQEALQLALRNNLLETAAFVYRKLAGTFEYASDFEGAKSVFDEAIGFCETEKMGAQTQMCYSCLSWILLRLGEWKKALEVCTSLIRDPSISNPSKSTAYCVMAIIKSSRGEIRSAEKHALKGIFLAQKEQFMLMYHLLHLPMAKIYELKENPERAREWYCRIIDEWPQTGEKHDVLLSLMDAAMFFREQEDAVSLNKCLKIISFICKETGNTEALGCMAYGLGLDALLKGEHLIAIARLTEAKVYLEPLKIPYQVILIGYHLVICYLSLDEIEKGQQTLLTIHSKAKNGVKPDGDQTEQIS